MLLTNSFEVDQPLDKVWAFFGDIPNVAACLPGAELTDDLGNDQYAGRVGVRMGPVKLQFSGKAAIVERDEATRRIVIDAAGSDDKGRGQAAMLIRAKLASSGRGTSVDLEQDLQLSGAAAQYGRGMIADVTSVLMKQFASNLQARMSAADRGESLDAASAAPAGGLGIALQALRLALGRVFRRFFLPYQPNPR